MVFFSCNACGESLKKNQVEKHYKTQCRRCEAVSCIDCNQEFWGDDFKNHTKCISEEEKYSGKNYKPKPGANKGEKKQNEWFQQVQNAIDRSKGNKRLMGILERVKEYPNIPRKQKKFENFARSSLNVRDTSLVKEVWDVLMSNVRKDPPGGASVNEEDPPEGTSVNEEPTNPRTEGANVQVGVDEDVPREETTVKKLSKRERKEERRRKMNKKEKKENRGKKMPVTNGTDESTEDRNGKKRKRKRDESEEEEDEEEPVASKKRATELSEACQEAQYSEHEEEEEEEEERVERSDVKFDWIAVISHFLRLKGEISVKRLRKKVLEVYAAQKGVPRSPEKLFSKFNKKIRKVPLFVCVKDRVKLRCYC